MSFRLPTVPAAAAFIVAAAYVPGLFTAALMPRWWAIAVLVPICFPLALAVERRVLLLLAIGLSWAAITILWTPIPIEAVLDAGLLFALAVTLIAAASLDKIDDAVAGFGWGVAVSAALCVAAKFGYYVNVQNSGRGGLFVSTEVLAETIAPVIAWALWRRRLWLAGALAVPIPILHSRLAPAAILFGLAVAWSPQRRVAKAAAVIAAGFAGLVILALSDPSKATSALSRAVLWGAAILSIRPQGGGLGWWSVAHPDALQEYVHSDPLQLLVEIGLPGLCLIVIPLIAFRRGNDRAAIAGLAALCLEAVFSFPMQIPATAFLGALLAGSLLRRPVEMPSWSIPARSALAALGMTFAVLNFSAEWKLKTIFDGRFHSPEAWFLASRDSLETFRFERHSRRLAVGVLEVSGQKILDDLKAKEVK